MENSEKAESRVSAESQTADSRISAESQTADSRNSAEFTDLLESFQNLRVNNAPVPVPLYSENMWAVQEQSGRENFSGSNLQYETIPSSNCRFPSANASIQANPFQRSDFQLSVYDDIVLLAQDQEGLQYLKEKLMSRDSRIMQKTFWTVYSCPFSFMKHQNGRLVFITLIETCRADQLRLITRKITSQDSDGLFLDTATENIGSYSIKKFIKELAKTPLIYDVMLILKRLFTSLMINKYGSSIILQCLESRYSRENDLIYQAALEHCLALSCHEQGCIYLNNFIAEMSGPRRKQVLHVICMNAVSLSGNSFGNYVVQNVLKLENPELMEKICLAFRGNCINLSMKKEASFVIQKCLRYQTLLNCIVEEFLNSDQIFQVANDRYGNYVIQTALEETRTVEKIDLHQRLVMKLRQRLLALRFGYGKHVYNFVARELHLISRFRSPDL